MKKLVLILVLMASTTFGLVAETVTSPLYYQVLRIAKIYPMSGGYRVLYYTPVGTVHNLYIPLSWFSGANSKAVIITGNDPAYPYLAVYWKNDKFDFVKLYVQSNPSDPSWGMLPPGFDVKGKFPTDGQLTIKWQ